MATILRDNTPGSYAKDVLNIGHGQRKGRLRFDIYKKRFVTEREFQGRTSLSRRAEGVGKANRRKARTNRRRKSSLAQQYKDAYAEAKDKNESRYNEILGGQDNGDEQTGDEGRYDQASQGGYRDRFTRNMEELDRLSNQERRDIYRRYGDQNASQQAGLNARGLSGTTIAPTMANAMARQQDESLLRLQDQTVRERIGLDTRLSEDTLRFQERREDEYPDLQQMVQLAQMEGQARGGVPGYGRFGTNQNPQPTMRPLRVPGMGMMASGNVFRPYRGKQGRRRGENRRATRAFINRGSQPGARRDR